MHTHRCAHTQLHIHTLSQSHPKAGEAHLTQSYMNRTCSIAEWNACDGSSYLPRPSLGRWTSCSFRVTCSVSGCRTSVINERVEKTFPELQILTPNSNPNPNTLPTGKKICKPDAALYYFFFHIIYFCFTPNTKLLFENCAGYGDFMFYEWLFIKLW